MNSKRIAQLIRERDSYRRECIAERWLCVLLLAACLVVIATKYPIASLLMFGSLATLVFIGGLCWSAKRADHDMGIE